MEIIAIILVLVGVVYFFNKDKGSKTPSSPATSRPSSIIADENGNGVTSKAELKKLTKNQLIELADKKNLKVKKSGTKAAVINEIHAKLK
jgi:hypothetical protein